MFNLFNRYSKEIKKVEKLLMIVQIRECLENLNYTGKNAAQNYAKILRNELGMSKFEDSEKHGILCHFLYRTPWITKTRAVLNFLVDHEDANINSPSCFLSRTPLMLLCEKEEKNNILMLKLIYRGAEIHGRDSLGFSPLHCAVASKNYLAVETLLDNGADVDCMDNNNWTPLYLACRYNSPKIIEILLEHQAKRYIAESITIGKTPIEGALFNGNIDAALMIFQKGEDFPPKLLCSVTYHLITGSFPLVQDAQEKRLQLFYSIWNNKRIVFCKLENRSIIYSYLQKQVFPPNEWFKCLKIMLASKIGHELTRNYCNWNRQCKLICELDLVQISKTQRMELIQSFVSSGYVVLEEDVFRAFIYYGWNEEVEFLIWNLESRNICSTRLGLVHLLCGLEKDLNWESLFCILEDDQAQHCELIKFIFNHFTFPNHAKETFLEMFADQTPRKNAEMVKAVNNNPNWTSLVELARNATRRFIQTKCEVKSPRDFYESIDNLKIPTKLKDLIKLKRSPTRSLYWKL